MNDDEIFNEIRALRPEKTDWATSTEGRGVMARAIAMGENAQANPSRLEKPAVRRTRRIAFAGIGASAVLITGVAAATLAFQKADSPTQAGCYEKLDAQANTTEASASLVTEIGPVKACAQTPTELSKPVDVSNLVS